MRSSSLPPIAAGVFAGLTGLASLIAAIGLIWPGSAFGTATDLAWVHESRATALAALPAITPADRDRAATETLRGLGSDPSNPTAWLRLAYLDTVDDGRLGPQGVDYLRRSYTVAPYGPDNTAWRLPFAFEHWQELDPSLRTRALDELHVALEAGEAYDKFPNTIANSAGRLAAALTVRPFATKRAEARKQRWRENHPTTD